MAVIVQILIALIIAGFVFWVARRLVALLSPYLEPIFAQLIELAFIILAVAIVIWYVVIPLLHLLAGVNVTVTGLH